MDEKNIISASAGSQIQVAGANNYQPNYNPNSAAFGSQIQLATVNDYQRASTDPNNTELKTGLCAVPDVAFEQTANCMGGLDNFLAWGNSLIGNDEGKQFYLDKAAECEKEENRVHEYFKGLAPDKNLYEFKVRQGMLTVDMAMIASLAKDGVVLGVKVAGKMPKSVEELRELLLKCFGKGEGINTVNKLSKSGEIPLTGVDKFDRLAFGTEEFNNWKNALKIKNYEVVENYKLPEGNPANVLRDGTVEINPNEFRYIDMLHESRHIYQDWVVADQTGKKVLEQKGWFKRDLLNITEVDAYTYEASLAKKYEFSDEYQAYLEQRIKDYGYEGISNNQKNFDFINKIGLDYYNK